MQRPILNCLNRIVSSRPEWLFIVANCGHVVQVDRFKLVAMGLDVRLAYIHRHIRIKPAKVAFKDPPLIFGLQKRNPTNSKINKHRSHA